MSIVESIIGLSKMNKSDRIVRLIQLSVKQDQGIISLSEIIELAIIQFIRETNGEIDEVLKSRQFDGN